MSHVNAVDHAASGDTVAARTTARVAEVSPSHSARIAGGLYLAVVITGMFALFARPALIVPGDAAATAANILASEGLFRLAWTADLVATVCYVGVTVFLHALLAPVSRTVSLLATFLGFAGCVIGAALSLNGLLPLVLLGAAPHLSRPEAGARVVWVAYRGPRIEAHYADGRLRRLGPDDEMDGGEALPGFRLKVRSLLDPPAR